MLIIIVLTLEDFFFVLTLQCISDIAVRLAFIYYCLTLPKNDLKCVSVCFLCESVVVVFVLFCFV